MYPSRSSVRPGESDFGHWSGEGDVARPMPAKGGPRSTAGLPASADQSMPPTSAEVVSADESLAVPQISRSIPGVFASRSVRADEEPAVRASPGSQPSATRGTHFDRLAAVASAATGAEDL